MIKRCPHMYWIYNDTMCSKTRLTCAETFYGNKGKCPPDILTITGDDGKEWSTFVCSDEEE